MKTDYTALIEHLRENHFVEGDAFSELRAWRPLIPKAADAIEKLVAENERLRPKRPKPVSKTRRQKLADAKPARDAYREAHPWCEFVEDNGQRCWRRSVDLHEIVSRARGGSLSDPENLAALCRPHHDWTTTHPREATARGYLKSKAVGE